MHTVVTVTLIQAGVFFRLEAATFGFIYSERRSDQANTSIRGGTLQRFTLPDSNATTVMSNYFAFYVKKSYILFDFIRHIEVL